MTPRSEITGKNEPLITGKNIGQKAANMKPLPNFKTGNIPYVVTAYSTENQLKPIT